jgi:multiple sugar transport system permease protein
VTAEAATTVGAGERLPRPPRRAGIGGPNRIAYLLLLPSLAFLVVFFAWPMVQAILLAFRDDNGFTLEYMRRMIDDRNFFPAVRNTAGLIVLVIPLQFTFALAMALLVSAKLKATPVLLYILAVPIAVSDLAAGIVWFSIFNESGFLNSFLGGIGAIASGERIFWLSSASEWRLLGTVVVAEVWRATSLVFLILLAGMQSIPEEYDEAAQVFGAGYWDRLWHIKLPLLRPSIQVALILRTILAFQIFAVVIALTGGVTRVLSYEAFTWYRRLQNEHVAAAYATLILGVSMLIAFIYLRTVRSHEAQR